MGSALSRTFNPPPPSTANAPPHSVDRISTEEQEAKSEKVDSINLPCPVRYEELSDEASWILTPNGVVSMRSPLIKFLNDKLGIEHHVFIKPLEQPPNCTNVRFDACAFGTFYNVSKLLISGRISTSSLTTRLKYLESNLSCDTSVQLWPMPNFSLQLDYKGNDYRYNFLHRPGMNAVSYIQSLTPTLSVGSQIVCKGDTNFGEFAVRYSTKNTIATGAISSKKSVRFSYVQNVSEKVSFASEFAYTPSTKEVISNFGCQYTIGECLLRAQMDFNAVITSYYEANFVLGSKFFLYSQIDPVKKNQTFGYGLRLGGDKYK